MENTYRIAECNIRICSIWDRVHRMCQDYQVSDEADFCVLINQDDIEAERIESFHTAEKEGRQIKSLSDAYLETLAVYRKIAEKMLAYDTILFHGSAISVDGQGYLFIASSGTGKSTHARLWREMLGDRAIMVNDDKPLVRVSNSGVVVYGTPWNGKHRLGSNISVPLRSVCSLEQAKVNSISSVSSKDAVTMLLQQSFHPSEAAAMQKMLVLLDRMTKSLSFYHLLCNMEPEAARISWQAMCPSKIQSANSDESHSVLS